MVEESELEKMARIKEDLAKDPLKQIEHLDQINKEQEQIFAKREKELLIKIAQQTEENRKDRETKAKAERAKEIAEYKYYNQQKEEIDSAASLINPKDEKDPEKVSRRIFVDRLKARRERSQRIEEEKKDKTYYI